MIGRLTDRWRRTRWSNAPRINHVEYVDNRNGLPTSLDRHMLYLLGTPERPKWAVLHCPCGTGHTIELSLLDGQPGHQWHVVRTSPATLSPSIDVHEPSRRCHYWLRDGRVRWVKDMLG